jgi:NADH-quinone oxidoreductase subunit N
VVISLYYYFRVIRAIYWSKDVPNLASIPMSRPMRLAVVACIAGMFWLGLFPGALLTLATEAVKSFGN